MFKRIIPALLSMHFIVNLQESDTLMRGFVWKEEKSDEILLWLQLIRSARAAGCFLMHNLFDSENQIPLKS